MKKGFTLIELMVTVIIVGILAAIALPQYRKAVNKARLAEAVMDMANIQRGMDMYWMQFHREFGVFTNDAPKLDINIKGKMSYYGAGMSATANFQYGAGCDVTGNCTIGIIPFNTDLPTLQAVRTKSGVNITWTKSCSGGLKGFCESLVSQGFTNKNS